MSQPNLSVPATVGMTDLLNNETRCKVVARNYNDLRDIIMQIQLDVTDKTNRDDVGPTILALKHVIDIFSLFKAKGDLLLKDETKTTK